MKLILTSNDHADAVNAYLLENYGLRVDVEPAQLGDVELDIYPKGATPPTESKQKVADVDADREAVIAEADRLGITYRSNIGTDTLQERIDEYYLEQSKVADDTVAIEEDDEDEDEDTNFIESEDTDDEDDEVVQEEAPKELPLNDDDDLNFFTDDDEDSDDEEPEPEEEEPVAVSRPRTGIFANLNNK